MITQNKNVCQLDTAVEDTELYCFNTEGDRNPVISQGSCRMDVTRLEQGAYIKIAVLRGRNARECHSEPMASTSSLRHSLAFLPHTTAILI